MTEAKKATWYSGLLRADFYELVKQGWLCVQCRNRPWAQNSETSTACTKG